MKAGNSDRIAEVRKDFIQEKVLQGRQEMARDHPAEKALALYPGLIPHEPPLRTNP